MIKVNVDISHALPFVDGNAFKGIEKEVSAAHRSLIDGSGKGNDFLGWLNLPTSIPAEMISQINEDADRIRRLAEVLVVIGIGGSYLGAKALIDALGYNYPMIYPNPDFPHVLFAGNNLDEDYHYDLLKILDEKSYAVAVISKSGTTTEPAVAFRLIRDHLERKYGKTNVGFRIIAITDKSKGALKKLADAEGYRTYVIPDDIGGRYSVLTPVGLLPVAVAGFNIENLVNGAKEMQDHLSGTFTAETNPAIRYAAMRNALLRNEKAIEILVNYKPGLVYFSEWWKQLFGESEGKENKGLFPASVTFTADLHSMGQYIQEGRRNLFETVLSVDQPLNELRIPLDADDTDGLNFIAGKRLSEVDKMAELGTRMAHTEGNVPNIRISVPVIDAEVLGQLIYFFEFACALSGYTLGVNPFDQPGVEAYKGKMFSLLGKPGY